jgi:Cell wall-active antibiotics response 4TMS YvqF
MQERTTTTRAGYPMVSDEPAQAVEVLTQHPGPHISELLSGHETKLSGVVPSGLRLRVQLGYIELDLTEAAFEPGITTIEVQAFMGYVQIRFPAGIRVESHGQALFGFFSFKNKRGRRAQDATDTDSVVRVTGRVTFGFAEGR